MAVMDEVADRLGCWLRAQLPDTEIRIEGLDRVEFGHSAETIVLTVVRDGRPDDVVLRMRPPPPGLLEPYDLQRQFDILRALEPTAVRSPGALWYEPTGGVLGRPFYVMERLPGTVFERGVPEQLASDSARVRRMCEGLADQIAAIHLVDLRATGLDRLPGGDGYLERELDHWSSETDRVRRGPLPALDRLVGALREAMPEAAPTVTLVHGDAKPGNFAFDDGGEVTAVLDWELAGLGDPRADIGWAEVLWPMPGYFTSSPGAPTVEQFVARWERDTGLAAQHRPWFRALAQLKMAVILLVGGHIFDAGHSDDLRLGYMAQAVHPATKAGLRELGVEEDLAPGPVLPREERIREEEGKQHAQHH